MKTNKNISSETIKAYLAGTLSHAQTYKFEKAMLNDAVLRDVVEGYEISRNKDINFQKVDASLSARLKSRVGEEQREIYPLWQRVPLYARAASVLLFLGIGVYFLTKNSDMESTEKMASVQPPESKNHSQSVPPIIIESEEIAQENTISSNQKMKAEMDKIVGGERQRVAKNDRGGEDRKEINSISEDRTSESKNADKQAEINPPEPVEMPDKENIVASKPVPKSAPTVAYETQSSRGDIPASATPAPVMKREDAYSKSKVTASESRTSSPDSPTPKGWNEEYLKYLKLNLKKPERAIENQIVGSVEVEFEVNKKGEAFNLKIIKSLGYGCDEEAIRLIKEGLKWLPETDGRDKGNQRLRQVVNF